MFRCLWMTSTAFNLLLFYLSTEIAAILPLNTESGCWKNGKKNRWPLLSVGVLIRQFRTLPNRLF